MEPTASHVEDRATGISGSRAGDINHDGFDDVVVGSIERDVYVVFGHGGVFSNSIDLSTLTNPIGMVLATGPRESEGYLAVSDAGDVNGDGIDDLLVGDSEALIFNNEDDRSDGGLPPVFDPLAMRVLVGFRGLGWW